MGAASGRILRVGVLARDYFVLRLSGCATAINLYSREPLAQEVSARVSRFHSVALLVVVGVAVSLTGCAGQTATEVELPAQDRARWVMPLDEFQAPSALWLPNYAENLLIADCLGENDIEWPIPWEPTDDSTYLEAPANLSGFPALTEQLARESGYRANFSPGDTGAPTDESMEQRRRLNAIATSTPGFEPIFDACLEEARKQVPTDALTGSANRIFGWIGQTMQAAQQAPAVTKADATWQQCMRDAGYIAVPSSPLGSDEWMPTAALREELGIPDRWGPGDGAPENALTAEEIDLAVDDAACRESSGWSQAIYTAIWDAQAKLVTEQADELVRIRDEWESAREGILAIIAAYAPTQR